MSSLSNLRTKREDTFADDDGLIVWRQCAFMSGYVGGGVSRALKTPAARPRLLSRSDQLASPSVRLGHYSTKVDVKILSSAWRNLIEKK